MEGDRRRRWRRVGARSAHGTEMTEEPTSDHATEDIPPHGPLGAVKGLFVSVIEAARTRLDLAAVEAEIYLLRTIQLLLWSLAAGAGGVLGVGVAVGGGVGAPLGTPRGVGGLGGGGAFPIFVGAFWFL